MAWGWGGRTLGLRGRRISRCRGPDRAHPPGGSCRLRRIDDADDCCDARLEPGVSSDAGAKSARRQEGGDQTDRGAACPGVQTDKDCYAPADDAAPRPGDRRCEPPALDRSAGWRARGKREIGPDIDARARGALQGLAACHPFGVAPTDKARRACEARLGRLADGAPSIDATPPPRQGDQELKLGTCRLNLRRLLSARVKCKF